MARNAANNLVFQAAAEASVSVRNAMARHLFWVLPFMLVMLACSIEPWPIKVAIVKLVMLVCSIDPALIALLIVGGVAWVIYRLPLVLSMIAIIGHLPSRWRHEFVMWVRMQEAAHAIIVLVCSILAGIRISAAFEQPAHIIETAGLASLVIVLCATTIMYSFYRRALREAA